MKKTFILSALLALVFMVLCSLPVSVKALTVSNFEHSYSGTWVKTYDNLDSVINETGTVIVDIQQLTKKGKIKSALVTYDDADEPHTATGYIYKKHAKWHLVLNYSLIDEYGYMYTLTIMGHITKHSFNGTYDHWDEFGEEFWGGTITASY